MKLYRPQASDLDIVVVASVRREPTVIKHLGAPEDYRISVTPDYPIPEDRQWPWDWMNKLTPGAWRCFRGHQEALRLSRKPYTLVFEDDAIPNNPEWKDIAVDSLYLLNYFDVVSLHGRMLRSNSDSFNYGNRKYVLPGLYLYRRRAADGTENETLSRWCCGSLAYLIGPKVRQRIIESEYDGFPMDILLSDRYKFCVLEPSPFDHPKEGSLVNTVTA